MRSYNIEEIKKRIIDALKDEESGLTGIELAKKTGINRITLTKYLNVLETMNLIKKKRVGISNVWYLDKNIEDALESKDILNIRKYYIDSLLHHRDPKSIIINSIQSHDPITLINEVILPTMNTFNELYERDNITACEQSFIYNLISDSLVIIKLYSSRTSIKHGSLIIADLSFKNCVTDKMLEVLFYLKGWKTYLLGSISRMDPLFDIDFIRFINKILREDELLLICIHANKYDNIKSIYEIIEDLRSKTKGRLEILIYGFRTDTDLNNFYCTDNINECMELSEDIYKKFKS